MRDRGTSGGYPKIATVISADLGRFAQIPAGRGFRFKAISMEEAQAEVQNFAKWLHALPDRLRDIENFDLNLEALQDANVAGAAVSAVDVGTWQVPSPTDLATPGLIKIPSRKRTLTMTTIDLNCDLGEGFARGRWAMTPP